MLQSDSFKYSERLKSLDAYMKSIGLIPEIENGNLHVKIASTSDMLSLSFGEITVPETINYRTGRPLTGGLLCERIFGPVRDWECSCGKRRGVNQKGKICDRCGVEFVHSGVRRERFGHISLAEPVVNPIFIERLAHRLDMPIEEFRKLVYFPNELDELINTLEPNSLESRMFLHVVPVMPGDLRPVIRLETGEYASVDVNDLYRRVLLRRDRVARLKELNAPDIILLNERRMLQHSIDHLFINERTGRPVVYRDDRPLKSISSLLVSSIENLWQAGCDYSGKAIVIPDASLTGNQIGLSEDDLLRVYEPFVLNALRNAGVADTIRAAKDMIERKLSGSDETETGKALKRAISENPLVVAYQSTVSACYPIIKPYRAAGLSPQVCRQFGLRLNGDTISFHSCLTPEAREEARSLVGKYARGDGTLNSAFSDLVSDSYIKPLIDLAVEEKFIQLSPLEKALIEKRHQ